MFKLKPGKAEEFEQFKLNNANSVFVKAGIEFAHKWAELMEKRIEGGEKLADVAKECYNQIDATEKISGMVYHPVILVLSNAWLYCDEFAEWHNNERQSFFSPRVS